MTGPKRELSAEASRNVDNAFDVEHRHAQKDWEAYLENRPDENKKGKKIDPETGKTIDADKYFDKKREEHKSSSSKSYENMTPYELTKKIAEAKFHGDKTSERNLYDTLLDKIAEEEGSANPSRDLYEEYDYRIDEMFQRLHQSEQEKNDKNHLLLDPENVAKVRNELDAYDNEDKNAGDGSNNDVEGAGSDEDGRDTGVTPPDPATREGAADPGNRERWYRRHGRKILGGAAIAAAAGALYFSGIFDGGKDKGTNRDGSTTKTEQPSNQNPGQSLDDFMKQYKINKADSHERNKTVGSGFEKNDSANEALDQLKKNFGHHPVLLAEAVYAYQNGIGVDEARANVDEINKLAKSFAEGDHLSTEGIKWADKLGKSVDNGKARWVTEEEMTHAIWYNSGVEEKGQFDKFFINPNAGFDSEKILRVTLGNGKVIYLKQNCINFLWKDLPEQESTADGSIITEQIDEATGDIEGPERDNPELEPKNPKEDINANPDPNKQVQMGPDRVPAGEQKPATEPGGSYTPPASPTAPKTERPTSPTPEAGTPTQNNPAKGTTPQP